MPNWQTNRGGSYASVWKVLTRCTDGLYPYALRFILTRQVLPLITQTAPECITVYLVLDLMMGAVPVRFCWIAAVDLEPVIVTPRHSRAIDQRRAATQRHVSWSQAVKVRTSDHTFPRRRAVDCSNESRFSHSHTSIRKPGPWPTLHADIVDLDGRSAISFDRCLSRRPFVRGRGSAARLQRNSAAGVPRTASADDWSYTQSCSCSIAIARNRNVRTGADVTLGDTGV